MAEVRYSNEAVADLDAIDDYSIEQFGEATATAYMRGFDEVFALLQTHPLAGPARPDLGKGIRCFVHRKHRIFLHR